jgi:hypothetical protein
MVGEIKVIRERGRARLRKEKKEYGEQNKSEFGE